MSTIIKAFPKRPEDGSLTPPVAGWLDRIWQLVKSDTYTPTLTNTTNISDSSPDAFMYVRVGNMVMVSGRFTADTVAGAATATELGVSLPIPSNFTAAGECAGVAHMSNTRDGGRVSADATNNRAQINWEANDTGNRSWACNFMYQILG